MEDNLLSVLGVLVGLLLLLDPAGQPHLVHPVVQLHQVVPVFHHDLEHPQHLVHLEVQEDPVLLVHPVYFEKIMQDEINKVLCEIY